MSRTVTPPQPSKTTHPTSSVPQELIANRAYEKWCKRGRPTGTEKQDWYEAEAELRSEIVRGTAPMGMQGQRR